MTKFTPEQFNSLMSKKAREIERYVNFEFPAEAGNTALRFIEGNFRAQGWQGKTFERWKKNKRGSRILVKSGHLRSSSYYNTAPGMAVIRNPLPYAKIHNEGGTINMPPRKQVIHFNKKGRFSKNNRKASYAQKTSVRAYTIKIPQRQFAPTQSNESPVLNNAITRKINQRIKKIFPNLK